MKAHEARLLSEQNAAKKKSLVYLNTYLEYARQRIDQAVAEGLTSVIGIFCALHPSRHKPVVGTVEGDLWPDEETQREIVKALRQDEYTVEYHYESQAHPRSSPYTKVSW